MANIFDTSSAVQPIVSNQTPIMQGVVDTSTASAIRAAGDIASTAIKQIGSQKVVSEAQNILDNPQNIEVPELEPYMQRLGNLADGIKAGMQRNKAQIMARKVVSEAITQHPFYAKEIKERASALFGMGGSGSVNASLSPEEKAFNDYREALATTQLEFGVSQGTAENIIQSRKESELRKLQAETFTDDLYLAVNEATISTQDEIFKSLLTSEAGGFNPAQQRSFEINIERSAVQLQKSLMQAASQRGAVTKETFETIDAQVKQYKENMKTLVTNNTLTNWMKGHNDLAAQMITASGNMNYGGLIYLAESKLLSESQKDIIFQSMGNNERAIALKKNNPWLQELDTKSGILTNRLRTAYMSVMNDMAGSPDSPTVVREEHKISEQERALSTSLALNSNAGAKFNMSVVKDNGSTAQTVIDQMLSAAPENIIRWTTPQYQMEWSRDPELKRQTLEHELDVVSRSIRSKLLAAGIDDFNDVDVSEPQRALEDVAGVSQFYGAGANMPKVVVSGIEDNYLRSRLVDVYKVLEANPEIWEERAESASEYVNKLIRRPTDFKKSTEYRQRKSEALMDGPDTGNDRRPNGLANYKEPSYMRDTERGGPRTDEDYLAKVQSAVKGFKSSGLSLEQVLSQLDSLGLNQNAEFMARRQEIVDAWNQV